jgi:hypothetical protein
MTEFRRQLQKGALRDANRALLAYMLGLRAHFKRRCPDPGVSGLYQGCLDLTCFALLTPALHRPLPSRRQLHKPFGFLERL